MAPNPNECLTLLLHGSQQFRDFDARSTDSSKDSGIDQTDVDSTVVDEETVAKIIDQVEFYFSDEHLVKDAFLLKHVRKNRNGFVSLKLITSFKKVKQITKDWQAVAYACRYSRKLQLNTEGTKIRRIDPLPATDETIPSRTIIAVGIPQSQATVATMADLFKSGGSVAQIRIVRPESGIPRDVRHTANKYPEMFTCISAVVEFEKSDAARAALLLKPKEMTRLVEMAPRRFRKIKPEVEKGPNTKIAVPLCANSKTEPVTNATQVNKKAEPSSRPTSENQEPGTQSRRPWTQRRLALKAEVAGNAINGLNLPVNVIRMPYGPDGTRGFQWRHNKRV